MCHPSSCRPRFLLHPFGSSSPSSSTITNRSWCELSLITHTTSGWSHALYYVCQQMNNNMNDEKQPMLHQSNDRQQTLQTHPRPLWKIAPRTHLIVTLKPLVSHHSGLCHHHPGPPYVQPDDKWPCTCPTVFTMHDTLVLET